jgi:hypothetical protein
MRFRKFTKLAFPIWTRVPGTPFTLPGFPSYQERLPGMTGWVPRDVVERVSHALAEGEDINTISEREGLRGLGSNIGMGAGIGGMLGGLGGRLLSGEKGTAPVRELLSKGLNRQTLTKAFRKTPGAMKALPLAGAGLGALLGLGSWGAGVPDRQEDATQVSRGLLAEKVLQQRALEEAVKSDQPYTGSILRGIPISSASAVAPSVAMPGNMGI